MSVTTNYCPNCGAGNHKSRSTCVSCGISFLKAIDRGETIYDTAPPEDFRAKLGYTDVEKNTYRIRPRVRLS